jgi:hypothetical protein
MASVTKVLKLFVDHHALAIAFAQVKKALGVDHGSRMPGSLHPFQGAG